MVQAQFNLGAFLLQQGKTDEAIAALEKTLELNARFASGEEALAQAYGMKRNDGDAIAHWNRALALDADSVNALVGAARILASSSNPRLRDGREAVRLAGRAKELTGGQDASVLDTLGAAYAEDGKFADALAAAEQAFKLATAQGNSALEKLIEGRLRMYREGRAYRN
jgi:tetratricopeptide (TPR) repeat protein